MTQSDKELLIKDLCTRLPYGVMCRANEINLDGELLFINKVNNIVALYNDKAIGKFDTCQIADVKPYLRPMSSMIEEEKKEYDNLRAHVCDDYNRYCFDTYKSIDWLNAHHFDYRGLIERGLALEAPEGMYKF